MDQNIQNYNRLYPSPMVSSEILSHCVPIDVLASPPMLLNMNVSVTVSAKCCK